MQVCNGCQSACEITDAGIAERINRNGGQPIISFAYCGNQYFHHMTFQHKGDFIPTHRHAYGHVYQQISGSVEIVSETEGKFTLKAGDLFSVPAGIAHGMTALEDNSTGQCIHIMRVDGKAIPFDYELTPREAMQITGSM